VSKKPALKVSSNLQKKKEAAETVESDDDKPLTGLTKQQLDKMKNHDEQSTLDFKIGMMAKASDDQFQEIFKNLSSQEAQIIWKRFEKCRHSQGVNSEYESTTKGVGSRDKKLQLLRAFIKDGMTTKGKCYKMCLAEVTVENTSGYESKWTPLQSMLTKYGESELRARVAAGSILCRKNPKDHIALNMPNQFTSRAECCNCEYYMANIFLSLQDTRFMEFKDEWESESKKTKSTKGLQANHESSMDLEGFLQFARQDLSSAAGGLEDWDMGELNAEIGDEGPCGLDGCGARVGAFM